MLLYYQASNDIVLIQLASYGPEHFVVICQSQFFKLPLTSDPKKI